MTVIHLKLVDTINVRDLETAFKPSLRIWFEIQADKWVNAVKLHLDIASLEWHPLPLSVFLDGNGVNDVFLDSVEQRRWRGFTYTVVVNPSHA